MLELLALGILFFVFFFPAPAVCEVTYIRGKKYERIANKWYIYDRRNETWEIAPVQVNIKFKAGVAADTVEAFASRIPLQKSRVLPTGSGYQRFTYERGTDPIAVLRSIVASGHVEDATLDTYLKFMSVPNDPFYAAHQWDKRIMGLERAWDITTGSSSVTIAVIDGGIQYDHEDLAANIWSNPNEIPGNGIDDDLDSLWLGYPLVDDMLGWDFHDGDADPMPGGISEGADPHGTAVAGIVSAVTNNALGVAGVAGGDGSGGAKLVSIRSETRLLTADAIKYCWKKGINIVSMSFTINPDSVNVVAEQIDSAYAHGVLFFAATGNSDTPVHFFPARDSNVVAVGRSDENDEKWSFSAWGSHSELMAPAGGSIGTPPDTTFQWTTDNEKDGVYDYNPGSCECPPGDPEYFSAMSGTSAACPAAAGVAALLLSYNPSLSNVQVRQRLRESAVDMHTAGFDTLTGYGRVDAYRALTQWGNVKSDTTWSGNVYVSGDVTVDSAVTLTIDAGTSVYIAGDDNEKLGQDTTRVEFIIEGSLVVNGTSANPVEFRAWFPDSGDTWLGLAFDAKSEGGTFNFNYGTVENADIGIHVLSGDSIFVGNSTIRDCTIGTSIDSAFVDSAFIEGTTIQNCDIGVDLQQGGTLWISNSTVKDHVDYGIYASSGVTLFADSTKVLNNDTGIYITAGDSSWIDATLEHCTIRNNNTGVWTNGLTTESDVLVWSCVIDSNTTEGLYFQSGGEIVVTGNSISENMDGVRAYLSDPKIKRGNHITSNTRGIQCNNSFAVVESTEVDNNNIGVFTLNGANPDLGHATGGTSVGYNMIHQNTTYHVKNIAADTIMAENNWWGAGRAGPECVNKSETLITRVLEP